jgi:hypothetical protein
MNEKETIKKNEQEPTSQTPQLKKQPPRYTYEDKKGAPKIHESETESKPKKQRQQKRER